MNEEHPKSFKKEQKDLGELSKDDLILTVCAHGNSRSKFIARAIHTLGYKKAVVLGIADGHLSRKEKLELITKASAIVTATPSDGASLARFLDLERIHNRPPIICLEISEQEHSDIHQVQKQILKGERAAEIVNRFTKKVIEQLEKLGFPIKPSE